MSPVIAIFLFAALGVLGCTSVHVIDVAGHPIAGARVSAVTASVNGTPSLTNASGEVLVPRCVSFQQTQWLVISREGFKARQVEISGNLTVVVLHASQ